MNNARTMLQGDRGLDPKTLAFVQEYNPNRPDLMEQKPLPVSAPALRSGAGESKPSRRASRAAPKPPARAATVSSTAKAVDGRTARAAVTAADGSATLPASDSVPVSAAGSTASSVPVCVAVSRAAPVSASESAVQGLNTAALSKVSHSGPPPPPPNAAAKPVVVSIPESQPHSQAQSRAQTQAQSQPQSVSAGASGVPMHQPHSQAQAQPQPLAVSTGASGSVPLQHATMPTGAAPATAMSSELPSLPGLADPEDDDAWGLPPLADEATDADDPYAVSLRRGNNRKASSKTSSASPTTRPSADHVPPPPPAAASHPGPAQTVPAGTARTVASERSATSERSAASEREFSGQITATDRLAAAAAAPAVTLLSATHTFAQSPTLQRAVRSAVQPMAVDEDGAGDEEELDVDAVTRGSADGGSSSAAAGVGVGVGVALPSTPAALPMLDAHGRPTLDALLGSVHDTFVQRVREETGASFETARMAVLTVLSALWEPICTADAAAHAVAYTVAQPAEVDDTDARELEEMFVALSAVKSDTQQRNWAVDDDEAQIVSVLQRFHAILQVRRYTNRVGLG